MRKNTTFENGYVDITLLKPKTSRLFKRYKDKRNRLTHQSDAVTDRDKEDLRDT